MKKLLHIVFITGIICWGIVIWSFVSDKMRPEILKGDFDDLPKFEPRTFSGNIEFKLKNWVVTDLGDTLFFIPEHEGNNYSWKVIVKEAE